MKKQKTEINLIDFINSYKTAHWKALEDNDNKNKNDIEEEMLKTAKTYEVLSSNLVLFLFYCFYYKEFKEELFKAEFYKKEFEVIETKQKNLIVLLEEKQIAFLNELLGTLSFYSNLHLKEFIVSLNCYKKIDFNSIINNEDLKQEFTKQRKKIIKWKQ